MTTKDDRELTNLIISDRFAMQEKMDGRRMLIEKKGDKINAYNKLVEPFSIPSNTNLERILKELPGSPWVLDGELVGDTYYVFDCYEVPGRELYETPFDDRWLIFSAVSDIWKSDKVVTVQTWFDPKEKLFALLELRRQRGEGVIFKARKMTNMRQWKHKFYNTVDCIVINRRVEDRRTIEVAVLHEGDYHSLGKVKCEFDIQDQMSALDQVVEVRYRKVSKSGKLVEPVFLRLRDDKPAFRCTSDQIVSMDRSHGAIGEHLQFFGLTDAARALGIEYVSALQLIDNTPETD